MSAGEAALVPLTLQHDRCSMAKGTVEIVEAIAQQQERLVRDY